MVLRACSLALVVLMLLPCGFAFFGFSFPPPPPPIFRLSDVNGEDINVHNLIVEGDFNARVGYFDALFTRLQVNQIEVDLNVVNDGNFQGSLGIVGQTFPLNFINLHADPVNLLHAATKQYADNLIGGADFDLFLFDAASADIGGYKTLQSNLPTGVEQSVTETASGLAHDLQTFANDESDVNVFGLSEGIIQLHIHASAITAGRKDAELYWELFQRDAGGTETQINGSSQKQLLTSTETEYDLHINVADEVLTDGNRFVVKVLVDVTGSGGDPDVTINYEGITASRMEVSTLFPTPSLDTNFTNIAVSNNTFLNKLNVAGDSNVVNLGVSGVGFFTGHSTGDAISMDDDLSIGSRGAGGGCMMIGDFQICDTGNMGIVNDMNLDNFMIFRDLDGDANISFMFITPGTMPRFVIPREGSDFATNNTRSLILGGDIGQALDDDIILCSANGYDKIDCDTDATGADLGVQDDAQIRGTLFVDGNAVFDNNLIVLGDTNLSTVGISGNSFLINLFASIITVSDGTNKLIASIIGGDPTLSFINAKAMNLFLDSSAGSDIVIFEGQTAAVDTAVQVKAKAGQDARYSLNITGMGSTNFATLKNTGTLQIRQDIVDKDMSFIFTNGSTKIIRIDSSENKMIFDNSSDLDMGSGDLTTTGTGSFAELVAVTKLLAGTSFGEELVTNPNMFPTGTGWSTEQGEWFFNFDVFEWLDAGVDDTLFQSIAITNGEQYSVRVSITDATAPDGTDLEIYLGGTLIDTLTNGDTGIFTFLATAGANGKIEITTNGATNGLNDFWEVESVSVKKVPTHIIEGITQFGDGGITDYTEFSATGSITQNGSATASFNKLALGSNSFVGLGSGDANVSILNYDTLTAKSPAFMCSGDWCSVTFPNKQKTLWIQKDNNYTVLDIVYEGIHYSIQEFWELVQGTQFEELSLKLNAKIQKLQDKTQADNLIKQQIDACEYGWDGECFEIVRTNSDYDTAVEAYEKPIIEDYQCIKLGSQLQEVSAICKRETEQTETNYRFKQGCGWNGVYYCEVRELRN